MDEAAIELLSDLGAWEQIEALGGLDTPVNTIDLSAGMWQILCFTRAVLRHRQTTAKLVVIDEATSSMDVWQGEIVQKRMCDFFEGCTVLQVADLESCIRYIDVSVEMSEGKIARVRRESRKAPAVQGASTGRRTATTRYGISSAASRVETHPDWMPPGPPLNSASDDAPIEYSTLSKYLTRTPQGYILPSWMPGGPPIIATSDDAASGYLSSSGSLRRSASGAPSSYAGSASNHNTEAQQNGGQQFREHVMPSIEGDDFAAPGTYSVLSASRHSATSAGPSGSGKQPARYAPSVTGGVWQTRGASYVNRRELYYQQQEEAYRIWSEENNRPQRDSQPAVAQSESKTQPEENRFMFT